MMMQRTYKPNITGQFRSILYRTRFVNAIYFKLRGSTSFSKNNLDIKLSKYLTHREGTYVEIGANDGIQQSNSKYFETFRGWSGLLIEPYPDNFRALKNNRSRKNVFANSACVDFSYKSNFVELIYSDLMTTAVGIESDLDSIIDHIKESEKYLKHGKVHTFQAKAQTMNSILVESGLPSLIDFLSLDVEGAELIVLKGIDHDQFRFRFILVECRDIVRMSHYLNKHDYELIEKLSEHDYLFENIRRPT